MSEEIKDIEEILELAKEEIENNDENITATLDLQDLKSLRNLYNLYNKEKEKNKELTDEYMIQKHLINADFLNDYISKDKIKEKIEELEQDIEIHSIYEENWNKIEVLQELLEERK